MIHDGHRERLRQKAAIGATEKHEKLELFLFGALPRVNTNEISHALLDRFGGMEGVLCASTEKLEAVKGIGRSASIQLRNLGSIVREYQLELCDTSKIFSSVSERERYVCALFACLPFETTYMLMFSSYGKFLGAKSIGRGTATQAPLSVRSGMYAAKKLNAKYVIFAHNHPDKIMSPSAADLACARLLNGKFGKMGIEALEHYVVAHGRCMPYSHMLTDKEI